MDYSLLLHPVTAVVSYSPMIGLSSSFKECFIYVCTMFYANDMIWSLGTLTSGFTSLAVEAGSELE